MRSTGVVVVLVLVAVGLAGCYEDTRRIEDHVLVLHDITREWNPEAKQLSGHFILSNTDREAVRMQTLVFIGKFYMPSGDWDSWSLGYDDYQVVTIEPGVSMVFNYTFPEQVTYRNNSIDWTPERIGIILGSLYSARSGEDGGGTVSVDLNYDNDCLDLVDGRVIQQTTGKCFPWPSREQRTFFRQTIQDYPIPPPEVWPQWTDDSPYPLYDRPSLRPLVDFVNDFNFDSANIVYFEGEIR